MLTVVLKRGDGDKVIRDLFVPDLHNKSGYFHFTGIFGAGAYYLFQLQTVRFHCSALPRYTPSLRQLRQHALVLMFPPTLASRLASRLQQVCR